MRTDSDNERKGSQDLMGFGKSTVAFGKDVVTLLRDAMLFIFAVLLLASPASFNTVLVNAGFEEGSFVGLKWKSKLIDADNVLKEAQTAITSLQAQNDSLTTLLTDIQSWVNDPVIEERITSLESQSRQIQVAADEVQRSVRGTIALNAPLVAKAQADAGLVGGWGIVYGGDATLEAARYETVAVAERFAIPNAAIYYRQGSYRSVSVVESRSLADEILTRAQRRRPDSYIVNLRTWCADIIERAGYKECVAS